MNNEQNGQVPFDKDAPKVMTKDDVSRYDGITFNEKGQEEQQRTKRMGSGFHIRILTGQNMPWWKKLLYITAGALFLVIFLSVAWFFLMGAAVVVLIGAALYFIRKYLFR